MKRLHSVGLALVMLLAACSESGTSVTGLIDDSNIGDLLTADEVESFAESNDFERFVVNVEQRVPEEDEEAREGVEAWWGLEFSRDVSGPRMSMSVIDTVDVEAADRHFDRIVEESGLVESEQDIGERFAGLAPQSAGVHTVVMFRVADKVVLMTTTTGATNPVPVVTSDELVRLAQLVAPRIVP